MTYRERERVALQALAWSVVNNPKAEPEDVAAATERLEHVDRELDYNALREAELIEFERLAHKLEGKDVDTGEDLHVADATTRRWHAANVAEAARRDAELMADRADAVWRETGNKPWRTPAPAALTVATCTRCGKLTDEDLQDLHEVIAAEKEHDDGEPTTASSQTQS